MILRRRPELLAVAISLAGSVLVLLAFVIDITLSRSQELKDAEQRLQHFSQLLAEHNSRALENIDMLLREIAADLSDNHTDWREWTGNRGWEYAARRHSRALPQLRHLALFDHKGDQRFNSTIYPPPRINVEDRPYFQSLKGGEEFVSFGPYVARNTGQYTFALTHRILDRQHAFAGVLLAALELRYFQEFCWPNRPSNDFDAVLTNLRGEVIASCRPIELGEESRIIGRHFSDLLADGRLRDLDLSIGQSRHENWLVSVVPLQSPHQLRIVAALPEHAALTNWTQRLKEFGILAASIIVMLISGGWLVRRQVRSLRAASNHLRARRAELQTAVEAATAELAREKEAAELASTAKTRFLAAASHDLRQPLHALSLFSADLQRQLRTGSSGDLDRLAEQIANSANSLGEMLDTLLDVSRLDLGGVEKNIAPIAVQVLFNRLHMAFRRAAAARRISLRFRPSRLHVLTDAALLERLLANLLSNAIRYTPEGGRVLVAARRRGSDVSIEVRDNGIGIAAEEHVVIFKEFYQVGNAARDQQKGLGLGLAIVDRIARTLAAPIRLRSSPGAGTTIGLRVPFCLPPVAVETTATPVIFIGRDPALESAANAVSSWGQACRLLDDIHELGLTHNQPPAIVFTSADRVDLLRARLPEEWPVVAVGRHPPIDGVHVLQTPVRPAKLRALVQQLQKTLSKSMR
mgnify:CR=1 FL=1